MDTSRNLLLQERFYTTVGAVHTHFKNLSPKELAQLESFTPLQCTYAFRRAAKWLQKKQPEVLLRRVVFNSIIRSCEWSANGDNGKTPSVRPELPALPPKPKAVNTTTLRTQFQSDCTNDASWTLTEQDVLQLLETYPEKTLHIVFRNLGRFDNDQQQECFDKLQELLDQNAWETAMQ